MRGQQFVPAKQRKPYDCGMSGLRANRSWHLLWAGSVVSILGDFIFNTTMVLWIGTVVAKGQSWAPAAVSGVLIAASVPAIFLGPIAGVFTDRWNRRRTMMVADASRTVLMLLLLPLAWPSVSGQLGRAGTLLLCYAVVAAASCFSQFFNPSRFGLMAMIVDGADMPQASSHLMAAASLAGVIGPPLAAPLLFVSGVQWALVINAASFAASFVTMLLLRLPRADGAASDADAAPANFGREFREGLRFFATNRVLLAIAIGVVIATLGTGGINALNVFFITHNLHVAAKWYGTMGTADGLGAVLGALGAGLVMAKIAPKTIFWAGLILCGVLLLSYSRMTALAPALVFLALIGIVVGTVNTVVSPLLLAATPQAMLGRVVSVFSPAQEIANVSSSAIAGFLASTALRNLHQSFAGLTFGPYDTIYGIGAVLIIAAGLSSIPLLRATAAPAGPAGPAGTEPAASTAAIVSADPDSPEALAD